MGRIRANAIAQRFQPNVVLCTPGLAAMSNEQRLSFDGWLDHMVWAKRQFSSVKELADKPLPERLEVEVLQIIDEEYERMLLMMTEKHERVLSLAADVVTHPSYRED